MGTSAASVWKAQVVMVDETTPTLIPTSALANRKEVNVKNCNDTDDLWIKEDNTVAVGDGYCIDPGGNVTIPLDIDGVIYGLADSAGPIEVCIIEVN